MKPVYLLRVMLVMLLAASCSKNSEPDAPPTNPPSGKDEITLNEAELILSDTDPKGEISFKASADWRVSVSESRAVPGWLTVEPTSGKAGQATLTVTAQPNEDYDDRNAVITISSGAASKSLTVFQKKKNALILSKEIYELEADQSTIDVEVKSNVDFEVKILDEWITQIQSRGLTTHQLKFAIEANDSYDNREGKIVIKDKSSELADTVHVYQTLNKGLVLTQRDYSISEEGEVIDVVLKSNVDYTVQMPDVEWIEEVQSRSMQTYKHQYKVLPNETYDGREARIIFKDKASSLADTVFIYQTTKNALLLSRSRYEVEATGGNIDVEVKSNVDFEVKIMDEWITQIQSRGLTTHQLKFAIGTNDSSDNREGRIVIKDKTSELTDTVHVYQTLNNGLVLTQREYSVSEEGEVIDVVLKSSVDYTVQMPDVEWIEEVQSRSMQTYKHQYKVLPNETHEEREAQIIFKDKASSIADTVFIYQTTKNALLLSRSRYEVGVKGGNIDVEVKSNVDFEVNILDEWITQIQSRGLTTHQLKFAIEANTDSERTGRIVFKDLNSSLSDTISIIQVGMAEGAAQDREALIALYNATGGDNWGHNDNWCSDKPLDEWYGVYTDGYRVTQIILFDQKLSGKLPPEISLLTELKRLSIQNHDFYEIPKYLGDLRNLEQLDLNSSTESRHILNIPSELEHLSKLKWLQLSGDFTPLPEEIGTLTQLEYLSIGGPWYGRSISEPFPTWVQNLNNLTGLMLGCLNLTGVIPDGIFNLTQLKELSIGSNPQLSTNLSEKIGNLTQLTSLYLNGNQLIGNIPSSITSLKNLQYLYLDGNNLTGAIPEGFETMTNLLVLSLYGNRLSGEIPEDLEKNPNFDKWGVDQNVLPQQPGYILTFNTGYTSSDFSADGQVMTLQKATTGQGVDIVLLGEGFVDRDMESGGKYEQTMQEACEYLFALEPMKSYREYFNVYAVKAVSKHERFGAGFETALNVVLGTDGRYVGGNDDKCFEYAQKAPIHSADEVVIAVAVNGNFNAGTTFWHGRDAAVAYMGMSRPIDGYYEKTFEAVFIHEVVGHGIGKLADEYVYVNDNFPADAIADENYVYENYGWNANISYTSDPEQVRWKHLLNDPRFSSYTGIVEGGNNYAHGVWRPEEQSMMRDNDPYFNAPSREAIVKRIMRLAGEEYSFEKFATKDKYVPLGTKSRSKTDKDGEIIRNPSPVIVRR